MSFIDLLLLGFSEAMTVQNLSFCLLGALLGTLIGVLPGIGPTATIAVLLPTARRKRRRSASCGKRARITACSTAVSVADCRAASCSACEAWRPQPQARRVLASNGLLNRDMGWLRPDWVGAIMGPAAQGRYPGFDDMRVVPLLRGARRAPCWCAGGYGAPSWCVLA